MQKLSFLDKFRQLSCTDDYAGLFNKNIEKVCKFCSKTSKETTFSNIPHVLPELLGKNNYTSNDECDYCNELFGSFETDLANYISPFQTLIGQKTKNKIPIFQSRKKKNKKSTTIKSIEGSPNFNFGNNLSDFQYDYENKSLYVKLKKKKYIPINVFKSLVKIGLSLCPKSELEKYSKTIEWLSIKGQTDKTTFDIPLNLYRTRLTNKRFNQPFATLYKRKTEIKGESNLCLVVCSGVLSLQIFIPFCINSKGIDSDKQLPINEFYPAYLFNIDFKGKEKIDIKLADLPIKSYDMNFYEQFEEDEIIGFEYKSIERK